MAALRDQVAGRSWYHTLDLAPGVRTPGWFDLRPVAHRMPLPGDLTGLRCLDVGTFDGFWAFEMERRGAAEVVALDVPDPRGWDWPADTRPETVAEVGRRSPGGEGFRIAAAALGSRAGYLPGSIYDLDPGTHGTFDVVYVGSLLLHLRDPVAALGAVRRVCGGRLVLADAIDAGLTLWAPRRPLAALDAVGRPWWWLPNAAAHRRLVEAAGFRVVAGPRPVLMPPGAGQPAPPLRPATLRSRIARRDQLCARVGDPHSTLAAVPA